MSDKPTPKTVTFKEILQSFKAPEFGKQLAAFLRKTGQIKD